MSNKLECMRCHALMETGFVVDTTHAGFAQPTWYPGQPERSFWMGLKLKKDKTIRVVTLRCPHCGYLESYANRR